MTTIAFIGLGVMGAPMATNLVRADYDVVGFNRSREPIDQLVEAGGRGAESLADAVSGADVVITMVPDSPDVEDAALGEDGIFASAKPGTLYIDCSTISPEVAARLAEVGARHDIRVVDAPVSGGESGAVDAELSIMVGGEAADLEQVMPLFEAMGKTIVHVGGPGAGQVVKACNQVAVAVNYAALSEALVLGMKAGVAPEKILQVLGGGLANSRVLEMRGATMIEGRFEPGFRVDLHRKDLGIALATARASGVPLPVTAVVGQLFEAVAAAGRGDLDHSALLTIVEEMAGVNVATPR